MTNQIQELKKGQNKTQYRPSEVKSSVSGSDFTNEERQILLKSARSVETLIKCGETLERCDEGLKCTTCQTLLKFNFENGDNFEEENMPVTFRHLKYDLIRHLSSLTHSQNVQMAKQVSLREKKSLETEKLAAINCASAAYLSYKLQSSYRDFETIITEFHNSGAEVGLKNHSKEFARNFLPHMYGVLRKEICNFIVGNELPIGVIADKMTSNRRSRHIIGLRIPIFDINHESFYQSIYLEHNAVTNFTGDGLSCSIINTLEKFGLEMTYIRQHLIGLAVDGQYVNLDVGKHLQDKLSKQLIVSWDPMHRIELAKKHAETPKIVVDALQLIHDTMKQFSTGKSYEILLQFSEDFPNFYKPKLFKSMKFSSYCEDVFKTFICDYQMLISACEQDPDGYVLRDLLMNRETLFTILTLADICCCLGRASRKVQDSDLFPWQYLSVLECTFSSLRIMKKYLEDLSEIVSDSDTISKFVTFLEKMPKHLFVYLRTAVEMFPTDSNLTGTFHEVPLPEIPVSSKTLRAHNSINKVSLLKKNIIDLANYVESLIRQGDIYFSENISKNKETANAFMVTKHLNFLFNNDFLLYPQTNASTDQGEETKGLNKEDFNSVLDKIPYVSKDETTRHTLFFEFSIFNKWMYAKLKDYVRDGNICSQKLLFKTAFQELNTKIPTFIYFFAASLNVPISEAICETWGSIIDRVNKQRLRSAEGNDYDIGTNDKRTFIQINGPPSGYKNTRKFIKAGLISMFGVNYAANFSNTHRNKIMKNFVTSKVVNKVNTEAKCLPCFK